MNNAIARLLAIHPLLSLGLVLGYVAFLWLATAALWAAGHIYAAPAFFFAMALLVKTYSEPILCEVKRIRQFREKSQELAL